MFPFPMQIGPDDVVRELSELSRQALEGLRALGNIRAEHIQIGTAPKEEIYREDKVVLYHYEPVVKKPFKVPVLIVYALVNRPYMVDLQESRSLVRNLLNLGLDVYLLDWGRRPLDHDGRLYPGLYQ